MNLHSEEEIEEYIRLAVSSKKPARLCRLLKENLPLYKGKSANEVTRIRGFVLAAFLPCGLKRSQLPFILEELQNGAHPYLAGGAARALRGQKKPDAGALPFLLKALQNLSHNDDLVSYDWLAITGTGTENSITATGEVLKTLRWYGGRARNFLSDLKEIQGGVIFNISRENRLLLGQTISFIENDKQYPDKDCCADNGYARLSVVSIAGPGKKQVAETRLMDHTGATLDYNDFFSGKPAIVAFFYTRCDNPNKCSLTIARLAQLQVLLRQRGMENQVKMAAITYDPLYDVSYRLSNYCRIRRMKLDDDNRSFRVIAGFDNLKEYFQTGVNYIGSLVNRHRIELFLVDKNGYPRHAFTHLRWDQELVIKKTLGLIAGNNSLKQHFSHALHHILSFFLFIGIAFFPKCPFCWAAYLSAFGISSVQAIAMHPWLAPLIATAIGINLFVLWRRCTLRGVYLPFYAGVTGALFIIASNIFFNWKTGSLIGMACIIAGSLLNSLPANSFIVIKSKLSKSGLQAIPFSTPMQK